MTSLMGQTPVQRGAGVRRGVFGPCCILLGLLALPAETRAQQADTETLAPLGIIDEDGASNTPDTKGSEATSAPRAADSRLALSREITRMKADIATLARFARWQDTLIRIARTDPAEALRQRLPMSDCRASVLAPICDELTAMFRPGEGGVDDPYAVSDPEDNAKSAEGAGDTGAGHVAEPGEGSK